MPILPVKTILKKKEEEEEERKIQTGKKAIEEGNDLYNRWIKHSYSEPPEGLLERFYWTLGIIIDLIISLATFPAAIGCFLMEESIQTYGMGAYILHTAKMYDTLDEYLNGYEKLIDIAETATKSLGALNPISGGAVLIYIQAARRSYQAFRDMTDKKLIEQAERERETREKLLEESKYGTLRITSSPSNAEIWIDGENTELLTPETLKKIPVGHHIIELRYYDTKLEDWRITTVEIDIEPRKRKEIRVIIPPGIPEQSTTEQQHETTEKTTIPEWITAYTIGDHAIDGDTFTTIDGETIRLLAIDAPEITRPYGQQAKEYLNQQIQDKKLTLRIQTHKPKDGYGRTLAIVRNYRGDINQMLLTQGLAKTMIQPDDKYDPTKYQEAEKLAQTRRIGIWSKLP